MKFTYRPNKKSRIASVTYFNENLSKQIPVKTYGYIFFITFYLALFFIAMHYDIPIELVFLLTITFYAFSWIYSKIYFKQSIHIDQEFDEVSLEIFDDTFHVKDKYVSSYVKYGAIKSIEENGCYFFIIVNKLQILTLPKNDNSKEFVIKLKDKLKLQATN